MRKSGIILIALVIHWILMISPQCIGNEYDKTAIRELLLKFERGYEGKNEEEYISVFSEESYEYLSDMATPDDPSDDISFSGIAGERNAAARVFKTYENIDLEMTAPEITINGDSAEAKGEIQIVFVSFENPQTPQIYYAASSNTFYLKKNDGGWKIVRWRQQETPKEVLEAIGNGSSKNNEIEALIKNLGDDHPKVWATAMLNLSRLRRTAMDSLIETLHSTDRDVRIRTARILYGTQNEEAIQTLIEIIEDDADDMEVRVAAIQALSESGSSIVDRTLLRAARTAKPRLKSAACIVAATRMRKKMDEAYLIALLGLQSENADVRSASVESLGIMTSLRGADLVERMFRDIDEPENVRLAALEFLKHLGSEPILKLFMETFKDQKESEQIRIRIAEILAEVNDSESLKRLTDVAKSKKESPELRKAAIAALGATGNSKATKTLIGILDSQDADLRHEAVKSLEQLRDPGAAKSLVKVLMNRDENIYTRRLAGRGIVRIDAETAFGPLVQIMKDETESAPARRMAAERLASLADDRSVQAFIEILEDRAQPWWLRRISVDFLGKCETSTEYGKACIEALEMASKDTDERLAEVAREALKEIK